MIPRFIVKLRRFFNTFINFWIFVFERFNLDGCFSIAAALSYTTILSIVPFMIVIFTILRVIPSVEELGKQATNFIFTNFVPATGEIVQQYLQIFIQQSGQLTWIGTVFLIITSLMMLVTMEKALNGIWRVPTQRKGMAAFVVYWSMLTLAPLFLVGSVAISSYFFSLNFFADVTYGMERTQWTSAYLPFLLTTCGFTFLYIVMPNCKVKIRYALVGGLVAACLFELSKRGFSIYIANFSAYKLLYGAWAVVPIFLLWIYLAWLVALFGAEVTNALGYDHRQKRSGSGHFFVVSYAWIYQLWLAQLRGEGVALEKLVRYYPVSSSIDIDAIIRALLKSHLIRHSASGEFILTRNLMHLSLYEFYALLPWQIPHPLDVRRMDDKLADPFIAILEKTDENLKGLMSRPVAENFIEI